MEDYPPEPILSPISGSGFGIRAVARVIDTIFGLSLGLFAGILGAIALVFLERAGIANAGWQERVGGTNLPGWGLSLLGNLVYHSLTEGMYGASLGKLVCQLRVVAEDTRHITVIQAFKRSLAYLWDALFFGLIGYSSMKESALNQRYGDHWAKTVVIRSRELPAAAKSGAEIFVLAFLMGSAVWIGLLALGLVLHAM